MAAKIWNSKNQTMLLQSDSPIAETSWGFQLEMFDGEARVWAKLGHSKAG
jgi:hypothetical protein